MKDVLLAPVAQWIEYLASNQGVAGSSPAGRTYGRNKFDREAG